MPAGADAVDKYNAANSLALSLALHTLLRSMRTFEIKQEPIELYKILKFEGLAASGGEAKMAIAEGRVTVNGEVETRKRKQILAGDQIEFAGETIMISLVADPAS